MPKIADIEWTPNPNARRFILKEPLTHGTARSYDHPSAASADPLASALFSVPHVTGVFYVDRYLTVSQDGGADWATLEREVAKPIREAPAASDAPNPVTGGMSEEVLAGLSEADRERLDAINALLDERVRPALMMDGGGLEVMGLEGNILKIHYQGACGTCPSSLSGTLMGIEGLLRTIEPQIELVAF